MYEYSLELGPFGDALVDELRGLATRILGSVERFELTWRLANMPDVTIHVARATDGIVGFKIGYGISPTRYYSWLGGVDPEHRRPGIARRMMEAQHAWVQESRYQSIETNLIQDNSAMLALNLQGGFRGNGFHTRDEILRINMTKQLAGKPEARTQS